MLCDDQIGSEGFLDGASDFVACYLVTGMVDARIEGSAIFERIDLLGTHFKPCLLYTSPSPRDKRQSRMPSSA